MDGRDIDDDATALGHHVVGGLPGQDPRGHQVDIEHLQELFGWQVQRALCVIARTGVIDEDVQPAQPLQDRGEEAFRLCRLGEVGLEDLGPAAVVPDSAGSLLGPALVGMIVNCHVGSLAREGDRGGAADAAIGARDERGLSLEQHSGLPMT
jgi:hypothetical protein